MVSSKVGLCLMHSELRSLVPLNNKLMSTLYLIIQKVLILVSLEQDPHVVLTHFYLCLRYYEIDELQMSTVQLF